MSDLDLTKTAKDAGYIALGLGVIGFQRAQVARYELTKQVKARLADTGATVESIDRLVRDARHQVNGLISRIG